MKFVSEYPRVSCFDQEVLNYCFAASALRLPIKFNFYVKYARPRNDWTIGKNIYHYAAFRFDVGLYVNDPYSHLFMDYFIKTPWVDDDTKVALSGGIPSQKSPAISVIIPMYNAEEYIGECLDSLAIQTFQDFEVIVVDDRSTDNSVEVVERYMPKFNGRLKLFHTETNSDSDCPPRNIGIKLARGEYIQFIDADDMLLGTALETLYKAAILYDADVVYTNSCYYWNAPNDVYLSRDGASRKMVNIQTNLTIDDPKTNLSRLLLEPGEGNFHSAWTKFVRRDFMLRNKIFFANLPLAGDFVGVINIYCHAKRFLRISTPLYFYKTFNEYSMSRIARPPQEQCQHWFSSFVKFTRALYELERENEVLAENPLYCLEASKKTFWWSLNRTEEARRELSSKELYKILHEEFAKKFSYSSAILFSTIDDSYFTNHNFNKFKRFLTARIDIKLLSNEGDFQILSVSDKKATMQKPDWLQKGVVGYQIQSYAGELNFTAKATANGKVMLWLRGLDVRDPENRTKRIPCWIDYTKLTINEKDIFDTLTPA